MITDATDYTPLQQRGRDVYLREGCWYCHSQFVRPVTGETRRWGPVAELGEFAYDVPHLFGTRRIGPDLLRVGLKYSDEWHYAHFWDPRMLIAGFGHGALPRPVRHVRRSGSGIVDDGAGNRTLEKTPATEALFDFASQQQIRLTPNSDGLLFVPRSARDKAPVIQPPNEEFNLDTVQIAAETEDLEALVAYVQKLGMNRGKWRDLFEPQQLEVMDATVPALGGMDRPRQGGLRAALPRLPRRDRRRQRAGGDLHVQPAAAQLQRRRVQVQADQGAAADRRRPACARSRAGVRGTAMPAWYELPINDRLAVIQYIKYELAVDRSDPAQPYAFFIEEPPGAPLYIGKPPAAVAADPRSRQGSLAGREMLGMPRPGRKGRRREGRRTEGRPRLRHRAGRPHQRPVQVGPGGRGHLPHHDDRA